MKGISSNFLWGCWSHKTEKSKQCRGTNRKTPEARTFFDGTYIIICTHSGMLKISSDCLVNSAGPCCVTGRVNFGNRFSFVNSFEVVRGLKGRFRCAWLVVNLRTSIGKRLLVDCKQSEKLQLSHECQDECFYHSFFCMIDHPNTILSRYHCVFPSVVWYWALTFRFITLTVVSSQPF